ncbi:MAG TPA: hypothetical protein VF183_15995 [Acidimicrobiales bacterium]
MTAPKKLAVFAAALAIALGASVAAGSALEPIGLSNAQPEEEHGGMEDGMVPGLATAEDGYRLIAEANTVAAGSPTTFRFRITDDDGTVTDFDITHTKPMHVILVRRDFNGFQHLHPDMRPDGTWEMQLTIPQAGAYRLFADFAIDGEKRTLATDVFVAGDFRPQPLPEPATVASAGDGYTVELSGDAVVGEESTLEFVVRHNGRLVDELPMYLGARGHLVALRDGDLAYLHVHADEERLAFEAEFPSAGAYRLFLQFQHDGEVRTAAFTVDAEEESR